MICGLTTYDFMLLCKDVYEGAVDATQPTLPELHGWEILAYAKFFNPATKEEIQKQTYDLNKKLVEYATENPVDLRVGDRIKEINTYRKAHPPESSFYARLYANRLGTTVIAFRGTVPYESGDLIADAKLFFKTESGHSKKARDFYDIAIKIIDKKNENENENENNKGKKYSPPAFTGHSLGGYLAQIASECSGNRSVCITFNAPQAGGLVITMPSGELHYIDPHVPHQNIHNIDNMDDIIHYIGARLGDEFILEPQRHDFFKLVAVNLRYNQFHFELPFYFFIAHQCVKERIPSPLNAHMIDELEKRLNVHPELKEKVF